MLEFHWEMWYLKNCWICVFLNLHGKLLSINWKMNMIFASPHAVNSYRNWHFPINKANQAKKLFSDILQPGVLGSWLGKQMKWTLPLSQLPAWRHFPGQEQGWRRDSKQSLVVLLSLGQRLENLSWPEFMKWNSEEKKIEIELWRSAKGPWNIGWIQICMQRMKLRETGERTIWKEGQVIDS